MSALPESTDLLNKIQEYSTENTEATETFYVDPVSNQINGKCDGLKAVKQTIDFTLATSRFQHACFSANYGLDLRNLIGMPDDYIVSEVLSRVEESFVNDTRIKKIEISPTEPFIINGDYIIINIEITTIFGVIEKSLEVQK